MRTGIGEIRQKRTASKKNNAKNVKIADYLEEKITIILHKLWAKDITKK